MSAQVIAGYGLGAFYPPYLTNNVAPMLEAGWTTMMLGLFHPNADGDIHFNNTPVFAGGAYIGDNDWVGQLSGLTSPSSGNGIELIASFGGGEVGDFTNIQNIYDANGNSFSGTNLEANLKMFVSTLSGVVQTIDMDVEDNYNPPSFLAFCELLIGLGMKITFCPYMDTSFWTGALKSLEHTNPGAVTRFNLQCYAGTAPQTWADAITAVLPHFDTTGFIVAGARDSDMPAGVQNALAPFADDSCVGGGFIWNLDGILDNTDEQPMSGYVTAIQQALDEDCKAQAAAT